MPSPLASFTPLRRQSIERSVLDRPTGAFRIGNARADEVIE
jgi:hypothetical protein